MQLVRFITDFGNSPVLVLLSLALAAWIAWRVSLGNALLLLGCVGLVAVITAFLKAWFAGCHYDLGNIHSPSGHVAFSVVAYGGVATVLAAGAGVRQRRGILAAYLLLVLGIGITRVLLQAHTTQEVLAGYLIGGIGALLFAGFYRASERPGVLTVATAMAIVAFLALFQSLQISFENELGWLGYWLVRNFPICT